MKSLKIFSPHASGPGVRYFLWARVSAVYPVTPKAKRPYVLLLSMVAVISIGIMSTFTGILRTSLSGFGAVLEQELTSGDWSGEFPESGTNWEN